MSVKSTKIIDLNLFSGSSELLRQAAGGYFGDFGGTGEITFEGPNITGIGGVESIMTSDILASTEGILPKIKYATRLLVDEEFGILSDEDWKTIIIGGTYADKTYKGIYNDAVYADHANNSSLPYVPREIVNVENKSPSLSLTTEYYNYYERYQLEVGNQESELTIPNYYLLDGDLFAPTTDTNSCIAETTYPDMEEYLTNDYVNNGIALDTSLENILVPTPIGFFNAFNFRNAAKNNDLLTGYVDSDLQKLHSIMPFGNKLKIEQELADTEEEFRDLITARRYDVQFLKLLKEVFQGESGLQPAIANFAVNTEAVSSTGILTGSVETTSTIPVQVIDVPTMLLYAYKNPLSETENISVIGNSTHQQRLSSSIDTSGIYRHENVQRSLDLLNDFVELMTQNFDKEKNNGVTHPIGAFLYQAKQNKYNETVAFRIQKIGGSPTGDSRTENTIQNIWFFNTNKAIEYFDTQVKYDTEYTYKIYKYVIVQGYKYQLTDASVSRQISINDTFPPVYCLEMYDPFTGQNTNNLLGNFAGADTLEALIGTLFSRLSQIKSRITAIRDLRDEVLSTIEEIKETITLSPAAKEIINRRIAFGMPALTEEELIVGAFDAAIKDYSAVGVFSSYGAALIEPTGVPYFLTSETIVEPSHVSGSIPVETFKAFRSNQTNQIRKTLRKQLAGSITEPFQYIETLEQFGSLTGSLKQTEEKLETLTNIIIAEERNPVALELADAYLTRTNLLSTEVSSLASDSLINSGYPYVSEFNINIEPSLKLIEIPLEEKRMRIVDHPPNDFTVTPHHLLDQTNRLSFYCKYDTFSMNTVTYPSSLTTLDTQNKSAYLEGHDFVEVSELTQESVSRPRFIEVYRTTTKPTSYEDFTGQLRKTIDLRDSNGDIPADEYFTERVRENVIYYYMFRSLNENRVAGQMSPVIEAELINDGGYVYARFEQYTEDDLEVPEPKEPIIQVKKLFNIIPNIQHLELNTENVDFSDSSVNQAGNITLGDSDLEDPLFTSDVDRYFKIRLTSKKTGRKIDINVGFKKEVRK